MPPADAHEEIAGIAGAGDSVVGNTAVVVAVLVARPELDSNWSQRCLAVVRAKPSCSAACTAFVMLAHKAIVASVSNSIVAPGHIAPFALVALVAFAARVDRRVPQIHH